MKEQCNVFTFDVKDFFFLPDMIRDVPFARLSHFSKLENLPTYINGRVAMFPPSEIVKEIMSITHFKPKGRPPHSAQVIRYALLLRYTSRQA